MRLSLLPLIMLASSLWAASSPPPVRLARALRGDQIASVIAAAPAGARVSVPVILPAEWGAGKAFAAGDTCTRNGALYVCLQGHRAQSDWAPAVAPSLWRLVRASGESGIPAWKQPAGAHDAYRKGDRVTYQGHTWQTTIDYNVWAPGVYGWIQSNTN